MAPSGAVMLFDPLVQSRADGARCRCAARLRACPPIIYTALRLRIRS